MKNLEIVVVCHDCCDGEHEDHDEMKLDGDLYLNPTDKTQAQNYKCPKCGIIVTVIVMVKQ